MSPPVRGAETVSRARGRCLRATLVVLALFLLTCVGLAARWVLAANETGVRWTLESVVDAFNDGDREGVLRELSRGRTEMAAGIKLPQARDLLDRTWGVGRDGDGSALRLELVEGSLEVEFPETDSIVAALATGEVRLVERRADEVFVTQRGFQAVLNQRSGPPWENGWVIINVEVLGEPPPFGR